jgi:hypothetical protein
MRISRRERDLTEKKVRRPVSGMWYVAYIMGRKFGKLKYKEIYRPSQVPGR